MEHEIFGDEISIRKHERYIRENQEKNPDYYKAIQYTNPNNSKSL